jgi:Family of unknown function (DUF5682)
MTHLMHRLQAEATQASDMSHLMAALPALAQVLRYQDVRQTDTQMVAVVVEGLVVRITVGLPVACASLNDDAAQAMFSHIVAVHNTLQLLQQADQQKLWQQALQQVLALPTLHGLLAGRCTRLLLEAEIFSHAECARRLGLALSTATEPAQAARWVEGFLKDSGLLLVHDQGLWQVIDAWVTGLSRESFTELLPLLRRTFATFALGERRQLGGRVQSERVIQRQEQGFDPSQAAAVLPLIAQLLGLRMENVR